MPVQLHYWQQGAKMPEMGPVTDLLAQGWGTWRVQVGSLLVGVRSEAQRHSLPGLAWRTTVVRAMRPMAENETSSSLLKKTCKSKHM